MVCYKERELGIFFGMRTKSPWRYVAMCTPSDDNGVIEKCRNPHYISGGSMVELAKKIFNDYPSTLKSEKFDISTDAEKLFEDEEFRHKQRSRLSEFEILGLYGLVYFNVGKDLATDKVRSMIESRRGRVAEGLRNVA